ncbi:unnamed protein product, partial [Symbiodinium microadriaticum]
MLPTVAATILQKGALPTSSPAECIRRCRNRRRPRASEKVRLVRGRATHDVSADGCGYHRVAGPSREHFVQQRDKGRHHRTSSATHIGNALLLSHVGTAQKHRLTDIWEQLAMRASQYELLEVSGRGFNTCSDDLSQDMLMLEMLLLRALHWANASRRRSLRNPGSGCLAVLPNTPFRMSRGQLGPSHKKEANGETKRLAGATHGDYTGCWKELPRVTATAKGLTARSNNTKPVAWWASDELTRERLIRGLVARVNHRQGFTPILPQRPRGAQLLMKLPSILYAQEEKLAH